MEKNKRLHVALLVGGKSGEREVSLMGATQVEANLDLDKYRVSRYDTATDLEKLVHDACDIDVALIILHGLFGEDGTVQGMLELLGIPYQGSGVLGSAMAMDKNLSKIRYKNNGLPIAKWEIVEKNDFDSSALMKSLTLPVVVKPVHVGSSLGLTIARSEEDMVAGVARALSHDSMVMIEEFIDGREITVGVIGNESLEALPLVEIFPGEDYEFFDYEAKYQPGATREVCPAEIDVAICEKAQAYAIEAHKVLKLKGYSRTDMIVTDAGELYLLETNTIPGMTETSLFPQAAKVYGLGYPELLDRLIELALE